MTQLDKVGQHPENKTGCSSLYLNYQFTYIMCLLVRFVALALNHSHIQYFNIHIKCLNDLLYEAWRNRVMNRTIIIISAELRKCRIIKLTLNILTDYRLTLD